MNFLSRITRPSALEQWRDAAALVRHRWADLQVADRRTRRSAFAAYQAALDLEESAAAALASELRPLGA